MGHQLRFDARHYSATAAALESRPGSQVVRREEPPGRHQARGDRCVETRPTGQRRIGAWHTAVGPAVAMSNTRGGPLQSMPTGVVDAGPGACVVGSHCQGDDAAVGCARSQFAMRFDSTRTSARSLPTTRTGSVGSSAERRRRHVRPRSGARPARRRRPRRVPPAHVRGCTAPALIFDDLNRSSTTPESRSILLDSLAQRELLRRTPAVGDGPGHRTDTGQQTAGHG